MAGKHAKRKITKTKDNRGSSSERGATFDMSSSSTENLMTATATAKSKRNRGGRFAVVAGLLVGLCMVVLTVTAVLAWRFTSSGQNEPQSNSNDPQQMRNSIAYGLSTDEVFNQHRATTLSSAALRRVTSAVSTQSLNQEVSPLLIERVPDSPGHARARNHILGRLAGLGGWTVEQNTFQDSTPFGMKTFTNIIATANPSVKRRLILACHYDSKYFETGQFIGATDSAVPCAQILYLADSLGTALKQANATNPPVTLQLLFFDGEEAFVRWNDNDSLYGSRHLATKMANTPHPSPQSSTNLLDGMDMFILLDLLGTRNPSFANYFGATSSWYQRMANIEERLKRTGQTSSYSTNYFNSRSQPGRAGMIQDDHIPFWRKGVRILHIIPSPFPWVWHKLSDNGSALDYNTISNLSKIFHVFVAEYLSLPV